ncbi:MAG: hypothetical protein Q8T11_17780 [Elusimicrobiota bacterium]|nr:hypothetical protein [Elusimicrobiota bacterium]
MIRLAFDGETIMSSENILERIKQACAPLESHFAFQVVDEPKHPMYVGIILRNNALQVEASMDAYAYSLSIGDAAGISDRVRISIVRMLILNEKDEKALPIEESVQFLIEHYSKIADLFSRERVRSTMKKLDALMEQEADKMLNEDSSDPEL